MAYDSGLAQRLREQLADVAFIEQRRMFGGLVILVNGNMLAGVLGDELMVRVGPAAHADALAQPGVREMDFTGRPMTGIVLVAAAAIEDDTDLAAWLARGLDFAGRLPPKT